MANCKFTVPAGTSESVKFGEEPRHQAKVAENANAPDALEASANAATPSAAKFCLMRMLSMQASDNV